MVLLQEVDEGVPRSREINLGRVLATHLGFPHYAVGHNVTLRKGRYGNATLSRFPILRERNMNRCVLCGIWVIGPIAFVRYSQGEPWWEKLAFHLT